MYYEKNRVYLENWKEGTFHTCRGPTSKRIVSLWRRTVHITKNVLIYIMLKFLVNIPMKMKSIAKFKMFGFKSPMGCTLHLIGDYITCI